MGDPYLERENRRQRQIRKLLAREALKYVDGSEQDDIHE